MVLYVDAELFTEINVVYAIFYEDLTSKTTNNGKLVLLEAE